MTTADSEDPNRVDPAEHRGHDVGILDLNFRLPADRRDDDHRGPRRIEPTPPWRRERR